MSATRTGFVMKSIPTSWSAISITIISLFVQSCRDDAEVEATPSPTTETWSTPVFTGDGLPPSEDTSHETEDHVSVSPTPTPAGDDDTSEVPEVAVNSGLFVYVADGSGSYTGIVGLFTVYRGCHEFVSAFSSDPPDGVYYYVIPVVDDNDVAEWNGAYASCGLPPCVVCSVVSAEGTEDVPDATLEISSFDAHYVTISYESDAASGTDLTFYNCGDIEVWDY